MLTQQRPRKITRAHTKQQDGKGAADAQSCPRVASVVLRPGAGREPAGLEGRRRPQGLFRALRFVADRAHRFGQEPAHVLPVGPEAPARPQHSTPPAPSPPAFPCGWLCFSFSFAPRAMIGPGQ